MDIYGRAANRGAGRLLRAASAVVGGGEEESQSCAIGAGFATAFAAKFMAKFDARHFRRHFHRPFYKFLAAPGLHHSSDIS
jgi:hypothetical protein